MTFGNDQTIQKSAAKADHRSEQEQQQCILADMVLLEHTDNHAAEAERRSNRDINACCQQYTEHTKCHQHGQCVISENLSDIGRGKEMSVSSEILNAFNRDEHDHENQNKADFTRASQPLPYGCLLFHY